MPRIEATTYAFIKPYAVVFLHKNNPLPHPLLPLKSVIFLFLGSIFFLSLPPWILHLPHKKESKPEL